MVGSNAESLCRDPSSSVADLLYSEDSVLILFLSWESFCGYERQFGCKKDVAAEVEN